MLSKVWLERCEPQVINDRNHHHHDHHVDISRPNTPLLPGRLRGNAAVLLSCLKHIRGWIWYIPLPNAIQLSWTIHSTVQEVKNPRCESEMGLPVPLFRTNPWELSVHLKYPFQMFVEQDTTENLLLNILESFCCWPASTIHPTALFPPFQTRIS